MLRKLSGLEWIVHAVTCAKPNPKLRRVLERRGFVVKHVDGVGEAYHLFEALQPSRFAVKCRPMESLDNLKFDPNTLAVQYYFGDLQYWKLPRICIKALDCGFDGRALRRLSGLVNPVQSDIRQEEIDSAFREMGVNAPISKDEARLVLATDAAKRALAGETNVFNEATHIRIHICELRDAPPELQPIVGLSKKLEHASSWQWEQLEEQLRDAMTEFLNTRK